MESELWKPVVGYHGFYEVSNLGRVRRLPTLVRGPHGSTQKCPGGILRPSTAGNYPTVKLLRKTVRVHRIVLEAFVGPCPKGMEARHFPDRDHANNALSNLSWGTKSQNAADKELQGQGQRGESNRMAILTADMVREIIDLHNLKTHSQQAIARMFGVKQQTISKIVNRKRWSHIAIST